MTRRTTLTPPHKLEAYQVIVRAMGGNGADDQRAALAELYRRRLWLSDGQRDAALRALNWRFKHGAEGWRGRRDGVDVDPQMTAAHPTSTEARAEALALSGYAPAPVPVDARPALPVIFRAERSGDFKGAVTAVFPTLPGTSDPWTATCYEHVGQHGSCSRDWYWSTRAATEAESADLLRELRGIYERDDDPDAVRLVPAKRWTRHHDAERRAELARMGRAAA